MKLFTLPTSISFLLAPLLLTLVVATPIPERLATAGECNLQIELSTQPSYNWSSPEALTFSQKCLQSRIPLHDNCVFYTRNSRDNALLFASQKQKETIYDVYSPRLFDVSLYPASAWHANGHLRDVFRVTSRAYAISCSGAATLVIEKDAVPCCSSIWVTDEFDAIRGRLSKITKLFRASLIDKVGGVLRWLMASMSLDVGSDPCGDREGDVKQGLKKRAWGDLASVNFDVQAVLGAEEQDLLMSKLDAIKRFGEMAEEWALSSGEQCGL